MSLSNDSGAIDLALTPGGRVGDASPLAKPGYKGKRKLSDYEREVAHALMRKGKSKREAIKMARGIINHAAATGRWSKGKAKASVVAGAQASIAQRKSFSNNLPRVPLVGEVATDYDLAHFRYRHGWIKLGSDRDRELPRSISGGLPSAPGDGRTHRVGSITGGLPLAKELSGDAGKIQELVRRIQTLQALPSSNGRPEVDTAEIKRLTKKLVKLRAKQSDPAGMSSWEKAHAKDIQRASANLGRAPHYGTYNSVARSAASARRSASLSNEVDLAFRFRHGWIPLGREDKRGLAKKAAKAKREHVKPDDITAAIKEGARGLIDTQRRVAREDANPPLTVEMMKKRRKANNEKSNYLRGALYTPPAKGRSASLSNDTDLAVVHHWKHGWIPLDDYARSKQHHRFTGGKFEGGTQKALREHANAHVAAAARARTPETKRKHAKEAQKALNELQSRKGTKAPAKRTSARKAPARSASTRKAQTRRTPRAAEPVTPVEPGPAIRD